MSDSSPNTAAETGTPAPDDSDLAADIPRRVNRFRVARSFPGAETLNTIDLFGERPFSV